MTRTPTGVGGAEDDHQLAARLATEAGELLLGLRVDLINAGVPRWQVMDEGDAVAHHFLAKALADARPDDAILSEEGRDSPNRLAHNRVWIVDPLDGTNEYGEDGRAEWAVHVALVVGGSPAAGGRRPAGARHDAGHRARRRRWHRPNPARRGS